MSPERKRTSRGFAKHERARKAKERKNKPLKQVTVFERQRRLNTTSWKQVTGFLNLAAINDPSLQPLFGDEININLVREYYNAGYKDAISGEGRDEKNRNRFLNIYTGFRTLTPELERVKHLSPLFEIVNRSLFRNPQVKK